MNFSFTPEQEAWRRMLQKFTENEAGREYSRHCDENCEFPQKLFEKGVEQGFLSLLIPEEYGGMGASAVDFAIFNECVSKYSYEMSSIFAVPVFSAMNVINYGTEEQKAQYLDKYMEGKQRFSISITEPGAGSDAASVQCTARLEGDEWVINGSKQFSTGAHLEGNVITMVCVTDKDAKPKQKGISLIYVPNDTPGLEIKVLPLIVRRAVGTTVVFAEDVRVPKGNLLGPLNEGWGIITHHLELERLSLSAAILGEAQCALDDSVRWAKERVQFGKPIGKFQDIGHNLAHLQAELEAARLMVYKTAWLIDQGIRPSREAAMCKLITTELFYKITTMGMQVMGGYSFLPESDMERHWRMSKLFTIGGGTSEIQRMIIAKSMGL